MKYTNVYVLAVTNKNAHAAMCLNFITEVSSNELRGSSERDATKKKARVC